MIFVHLALQMLTLSSGFALWLLLPLLAGLLIYQCRRRLGAEKKRLALMGLCLIPPAALSLARNLFPELPLDPAALIYSRTGAYFLLNMILYFRLYQDKPEPEKGPLKTGEAIKKDLTTREREVFDHLISHASYKEIGAALFISLDTV